jgi:hypothetical protein
MRLQTLTLRDFRAFRESQLDLSADVVAIYARNGVGKTAIFDAIELAILMDLHRFNEAPKPISQFLVNVFADAHFEIRLDLDEGAFAVVSGSRGDDPEWSGSEKNYRDFVFERLVAPDYPVARKEVRPIREVFYSTHFLSQKFIADLARRNVIATLVGLPSLQRAAEKAQQVTVELEKRRKKYLKELLTYQEERATAAVKVERLKAAAVHRERLIAEIHTLVRSSPTDPLLVDLFANPESLNPAALEEAAIRADLDAENVRGRLATAQALVDRSGAMHEFALQHAAATKMANDVESELRKLQEFSELRLQARAVALEEFQSAESLAMASEAEVLAA